MSKVSEFFLLKGKPRPGPTETVSSVVFQNQIETTIIRMLERPDVGLVEVYPSTEKEFMRFQRERRREERDSGGGGSGR